MNAREEIKKRKREFHLSRGIEASRKKFPVAGLAVFVNMLIVNA